MSEADITFWCTLGASSLGWFIFMLLFTEPKPIVDKLKAENRRLWDIIAKLEEKEFHGKVADDKLNKIRAILEEE